MSAWAHKPCDRCGRNKGPKYLDKKYCGRCQAAIRREGSERAHRTRVARVYGLRPEDYDRLYEAQGGVCALCHRATGATRRLSVDHNHATGEVRGLLCRPCNDMLGHGRDEADFFVRAAMYLSRPPARDVLGEPC